VFWKAAWNNHCMFRYRNYNSSNSSFLVVDNCCRRRSCLFWV